MKGTIASIDARASAWARGLALFGLVGLVVLTVITIADVLMRWLFNAPIDGVADIGRLIVAINISAFFPLALAERHHIAIEFLGKALGPRIHAWLDAIGAAVTSVFFPVARLAIHSLYRRIAVQRRNHLAAGYPSCALVGGDHSVSFDMCSGAGDCPVGPLPRCHGRCAGKYRRGRCPFGAG